MAIWNWYLTDNKNAPVALLNQVTARQIAYVRNSYAEATATMLHSDPAATKLFSLLSAGTLPRLAAYRTGRFGAACRFCGPWAPQVEALDEGDSISLTFRSPFYQFIGDGSSTGRYTGAALALSRSASLNIADLLYGFGSANNPIGAVLTLAAGGSYAGLDIGILDINGASTAQTPSYNYTNVGAAIQNLTLMSGGVDFYERYSPDTSGTTARMAYMDTYGGAGLGSDKSAALRFEFGPTTLSNVSAVTRSLDYPANVVTVVGAGGLVGTASDAGSRATYGDWPKIVSAPAIANQTTLNNMAATYLRTKLIKTIGFTPVLPLANCPQPFDDFDLGDTVMFQGKRDSFLESATKIQINGFTLGIDDDTGVESMNVTDPLDPDGEEMLQAQIMGEVLL